MIELMQEKKDEEKKPEEAKKPAEAKPKKPLSHVKDFEEDMVYLFQFTRSPQVRHNSTVQSSFIKIFKFFPLSDSINLSFLPQVGVLAETSWHQVPGRRESCLQNYEYVTLLEIVYMVPTIVSSACTAGGAEQWCWWLLQASALQRALQPACSIHCCCC